jgi:hypothetical protein
LSATREALEELAAVCTDAMERRSLNSLALEPVLTKALRVLEEAGKKRSAEEMLANTHRLLKTGRGPGGGLYLPEQRLAAAIDLIELSGALPRGEATTHVRQHARRRLAPALAAGLLAGGACEPEAKETAVLACQFADALLDHLDELEQREIAIREAEPRP